jgi:hypothetical protein
VYFPALLLVIRGHLASPSRRGAALSRAHENRTPATNTR